MCYYFKHFIASCFENRVYQKCWTIVNIYKFLYITSNNDGFKILNYQDFINFKLLKFYFSYYYMVQFHTKC